MFSLKEIIENKIELKKISNKQTELSALFLETNLKEKIYNFFNKFIIVFFVLIGIKIYFDINNILIEKGFSAFLTISIGLLIVLTLNYLYKNIYLKWLKSKYKIKTTINEDYSSYLQLLK